MLLLIPVIVLGALQADFEVGQSLAPPAQFAGPWEELVAPGEVAGFSLQITTNADQRVRSFGVNTYVRRDGKTTKTYWSSDSPGTFLMRTNHLHFHQSHDGPGGFDVTLDLKYDSPSTSWIGSFRNPSFSGQVALHRPSMRDAIAPAGTWRTYSDTVLWPTAPVEEYGCLYIGVGEDNALVLWSEIHGLFLGYDAVKRPLFGNDYGELEDDADATNYGTEWSFTSGNGLGGDHITGAVSSDGSAFGGYSTHYGNGAYGSRRRHAFAWTRMLDLSCRP